MSVVENRLRQMLKAAPKSPDHLFDLLVDGLDWPIPEGFGLSDIELDWEPEELHLDPEKVAKLTQISQIPPLTKSQTFGVFVLAFEGGRLPIGAVRRLVQRLVRNERSRRGAGKIPQFELSDLLFFCLSEPSHDVLHVVGFREADGKRVLKALSWGGSVTEAKLDLIVKRAVPNLRWMGNGPSITVDLDYAQGFGGYRAPIRNAEALSSRMAEVAQELKSEVLALYEVETDEGPLRTLYDEFRAELVADLTVEKFADVYAQTMVYGLFTARVAHPEAFKEGDAASLIQFENPLLNEIYTRFRDETDGEIDVDELGLADLSAQLAVTDVESVVADFGAKNKREDPVVHFYEAFLAKYDPRARISAGAFYTPLPVVRFIVRAVDHVLKTTFGLPLGVADSGTWGQVCSYLDIPVPGGIQADSRFTSMLDPATGTGTFLVEWIRQAEASFKSVQPEGDWPAHLQNVVFPGMHAFEFMLAPYAIAHLRIALAAMEYDVDAPKLTILLTDTLDHPSNQLMIEEIADPVAAEGERAAQLKQDARFTVVIGNPPYEREQKDVGDTAKRKGGVVRHGTAGVTPLLDDVIEPMRAAGHGKHVKNLYNDYIYFWRYGTWRATERPTGPGIVAFITASSFLDGVSIGGLRHHFRDVFDQLHVIDLGGEGRGARTEENVFDILTPVAIAVGVRGAGGSGCVVDYARVAGTRGVKFDWLDSHDLETADTIEVPGSGLSVLTPVSANDYQAWPEITELFPWIHSGSQLKRTWPIGPTKSVLSRRWSELLALRGVAQDEAFRDTGFRGLDVETTSLSGDTRLSSIRANGMSAQPEATTRYGYRSFDRQWILADARLGDRMRPDLWRTMGPDQAFFTTLTSTKLGRGPVVTATPYIPDLHHFRGSYGARDVMPLWRDSKAKTPNLTPHLLDTLAAALGSEVTAEDVAAYVYALTGTAAFAERFAEELGEQAGPVHVPITKNHNAFARVAAFGRDLLWWHTWGERFGEPATVAGAAEEITAVSGMPEKFSYERTECVVRVGSGCFGPVAPEVWEFEVSGLKVLQSWLAYRMAKRKGKKSSPLDDIRPAKWTFTDELLLLVHTLEYTVQVTPTAAELLEEVVEGPVFLATELPIPTDAERKAPR
ncbi:type ISP restriction/modification enzyme [Gordonia sp. LSe1-13]|uniref:site-specific DNA-methyltransferase (adenine-specific) n=1 Tax=Gordonia sesuvii TaxID=3116777 RepID=A0ABU7MG71_9ACTN|nr:type ISP restriction/modification enzyme [Gordonia sp. LSe1-13]